MKTSNLVLLVLITFIISCAKDSVRHDNKTIIGQGEDQIAVVVVKGTAYEMGHQLGTVLKDEIKKTMTAYLNFGKSAMPERFNDQSLDEAWEKISPYIKDRFKEELKGLAEGSGLDIKTLIRAHMIPVLGDFACSGVAVWGNNTEDGHLLQIRNLDFTVRANLQDYPVIVVYLPNEGHAHVLPTFPGYIGAHAGLNAKGIALSEKGASPSSDFPFDLDGTHFSTFFRDLLYDADNLEEALKMVEETKLIKRYRFYIGDGQKETMGAAKIFVSSPDSVKKHIWKGNDQNDEMAPYMVENAIYFTMNNEACYTHLKENKGKYNVQKMIELSRALGVDSDNLVNIVYDATDLKFWIAYAQGEEGAKHREYVEFDFSKYVEK